jgi:hypothetical protein
MKTKMTHNGGMKLLAQGTHGSIYEMGDKVVKQFKNRPHHKPSLCASIKSSIDTQCDEVDYEYRVQQMIQDLLESRHCMIKVPASSSFIVQGDKCQYTMERIYPLDTQLLFVDMTFKKGQRPGQTSTSKQVGYVDMASLLDITPNDLAMIIGELFSALHFLLKVDGYDCELILGKGGLYFIDFDKVSCFEFTTNQTLIRKISEEVYDEKVITNYKKLARFLFGSFISMSLLPVDPLLKSYFLLGYKKYMVLPELMQEIITMIDEYSI